MEWIEYVEGIFYPLRFCEAALAVVHEDGDECETADPSAREDAAADDCHQTTVLEHVQKDYEAESEAGVVGTEYE